MTETKKSASNEDAALAARMDRASETHLPGDMSAPEHTTPIVIDFGKTGRRKIKKLKRGTGALMDDVLDAVDEVGKELGKEAEGKVLVPVVVICRRKDGRGNRLFSF